MSGPSPNYPSNTYPQIVNDDFVYTIDPNTLHGFKTPQIVVLRTTCPFCNSKSSFSILNDVFTSSIKGKMLPVKCEGCLSVLSLSLDENKLYPRPMPDGVKGLPENIDKYYQEALRCISADSPNGAVTLFRKTIHAIGIHLNITEPNDKKTDLKGIIEKLEGDGLITSKIKKRLDGIRFIGNDGAHININEPDMEQALILKSLMDSILNSAILDDIKLETVMDKSKGK
jgi:hypothetical protein